MRTYMARLGNYQFGIDTAAFQDLQRVSTYKWQAKDRIGRAPAQQNTGRGADTITLQGVIYPHYRGGLGQIAAMRAQAAAGEPLPLIYAFETAGQYCGLWCITSIEESRTVFFDNGAPRQIEFSLTLVEYGEDAGADALGALIAAVSDVAGSVDAAGAVTEAASLQSAANAVTAQPQALGLMQRTAAVATTVATTVSSAIDAVVNNPAVQLARTAVQEVRNVTATVQAVTNAAKQVNDITSAIGALSALSSLSASVGSMGEAIGSASGRLSDTAGDYSGGSANTLYRQEIDSATTALTQLNVAAMSVKTATNTLKGFF